MNAVMCYDTGFVTPRSYVWLTHRQVVRISRAVADGSNECRVLIGVPTYGRGLRSHNPRAGNIDCALRGVREAVADDSTTASALDGVAVFADYTTDALEWQTYDRLWPR